MAEPWLSVVTPSLNQGPFIADAVESVLAQAGSTSRAVEHIVVEGGSTDGTQDILGRYPHVQRLSDPGLGQSRAVNIGLQAARGAVIGWLNADDRYVSGAFAAVSRAFTKHSEAGIVYGNAQTIDRNGHVIELIRAGTFDRQRMLNGINPIPQPAVFIRAQLLDQIGLLDERLHYVMDYELWLRASQATRLVWIDEVLAQFRVHADSKTVSRAHEFWPEKRAVARAYGGPFFSETWRLRTLNRHYPRTALASLWYRRLRRPRRTRSSPG